MLSDDFEVEGEKDMEYTEEDITMRDVSSMIAQCVKSCTLQM